MEPGDDLDNIDEKTEYDLTMDNLTTPTYFSYVNQMKKLLLEAYHVYTERHISKAQTEAMLVSIKQLPNFWILEYSFFFIHLINKNKNCCILGSY